MRGLSFLPALIAAAGFSFGAGAAEWTTTYGVMTLPDAPRPGALRAPYSGDNGRVIGEMLIPKCIGCGPLVEGVWVETGSAAACETMQDGSRHWGDVELKFNAEYTEFTGTWDYCGKGSTRPWSGKIGITRLGPLFR